MTPRPSRAEPDILSQSGRPRYRGLVASEIQSLRLHPIFPNMTAAFYTRVMSRYRPPRIPGSPYITPEGEALLLTELHTLWKIERPEVTKTVSAAAANGDRSENGDYIYGKKRLREIDARVRFLRKRLDVLQIVSEPLGDPNRVWFGAWVTVENETGAHYEWRIVGPDEFDVSRRSISCDSPMGRALLGRQVGADITLETPDGIDDWYLVSIRYAAG